MLRVKGLGGAGVRRRKGTAGVRCSDTGFFAGKSVSRREMTGNASSSLQRYRENRRKGCVAEQDGSKTSSSLQRHRENSGKGCVAEREGWDSDGRRGDRRGKSFKKTQNFSKKEKCDERDENLSYSERDCMEILLYCGDCIGEDHKYFLRGHSVLVYLTLNIYEP